MRHRAGTCGAAVHHAHPDDLPPPYPASPQPFCKPPEGIKRVSNTANLGTILQGLRIENSPYNLSVMVSGLAA